MDGNDKGVLTALDKELEDAMEYARLFPFWVHKSSSQYDGAWLNDLLEKFKEPWVLRRHDDKLYCFGIRSDKEHFRSYNINEAIVQAIVWIETGDRWIKGKWVEGVDADGNLR